MVEEWLINQMSGFCLNAFFLFFIETETRCKFKKTEKREKREGGRDKRDRSKRQ